MAKLIPISRLSISSIFAFRSIFVQLASRSLCRANLKNNSARASGLPLRICSGCHPGSADRSPHFLFPGPTNVTMRPDRDDKKVDKGGDEEDEQMSRIERGEVEEKPGGRRPPSTVSTSRSSHTQSSEGSIHHEQDAIEPVTHGEPLGHIDTRRSVKRSCSRASSARSRPLSVVPRSKRRGLFGSITLIPEVAYPPDYKNSTKWGLTFIIALATAAAPLGSTVVYRKPPPPLLNLDRVLTSKKLLSLSWPVSSTPLRR